MNPQTWRPNLTLMGEKELVQLHRAATRILSETGLNVHHPELRRELAGHGATLGEETRVFLPEGMVEKALSTARKRVVVYDRRGEPAMPLGPRSIYFGTGSDLLSAWDARTGEHRPARLEDVADAARLCDALDEIDFVMSFALPGGIAAGDVEPRQYYAMVRNGVKPVIMTSFSGTDTLERTHGMACALAGGEGAFRAKPNYIMYGQFVSPLQHDEGALERLIFCARREVPLIYIPTIIPGASGPVTLAGSLALAAAECLAGLVMHQVVRPGAPFIFGACVSTMDMRTMLFPYGSPEWRLSDLAMAELSRFYGLPVFGTGGATDSKVADAQAGAEYAGSLLVAALAGTNLIHDVGYLDSGRTGSLESILLGAEWIRWTRRFLEGVSVSEGTLAPGAIREVGPGGSFLDHPHTLERFREAIRPTYVLDRQGFDHWTETGSKDYAARARDFALDLCARHRPEALDAGTDAALRKLCGM